MLSVPNRSTRVPWVCLTWWATSGNGWTSLTPVDKRNTRFCAAAGMEYRSWIWRTGWQSNPKIHATFNMRALAAQQTKFNKGKVRAKVPEVETFSKIYIHSISFKDALISRCIIPACLSGPVKPLVRYTSRERSPGAEWQKYISAPTSHWIARWRSK